MERDLTIRRFDPVRDTVAVDQFYAEHCKAYLPVPDPDDVIAAAADGYVYVVDEGTKNNSAKTLHAVAGVFTVAQCRDAPNEPQVTVYELAGMALRGSTVGRLGPVTLQGLLIALRSLTLAIGIQSSACLVSSVVEANERSLANLAGSGLEPVASPEWLRRCRRSWCLRDQDQIIDLILPPKSISMHARTLLDFLESPVLSRVNRTTGEEEWVNFSVELDWPTEQSQVLQSWATGTLEPDWETAVPKVREVYGTPEWIRLGD